MSVLSHDVEVKRGAIVRNSIIYSGAIIGENAVVENAIIDENVAVGSGARIGVSAEKEKKIAVLGRGITVSDGAVVVAGEIIDKNVGEEN